MAIRQRGEKWIVDLCVAGRRQYSTYDTQADATLAEAKLKVELLSGQKASVGEGWTLQQAYERCLAQVWTGKAHANNVAKIYPKLAAFFGSDTPLNAINTVDCDAYCQAMIKRGRANGTINRHRAVLSRIFTFAAQRKDLSKCEAKPHMEHYQESVGRQKYFTLAEEKQITGTMRHLGYPEQADFVEFLLDTGARVQSDGFALTWDRVDFAHNMLVFAHRKCDKITGIPLTKRVKAILEARKAAFPLATHVWPFKHWWIKQPWNRVKEILGKSQDEEWVPHTCRHTTASRLVQAGINLSSVRDFMGHSSIVVTQRYAHLCPTAMLPCLAALEPQVVPLVPQVVAPVAATDTLPPSSVTA